MKDSPKIVSTLLRRWRRSSRLPYAVFFSLLVIAGLYQACQYWWGVQINQMLSNGVGTAERVAVFPASWKKNIDRNYLEPMEPIVSIRLMAGGTFGKTRRAISGSQIRQLKWLPFLKRLEIYGPMTPEAWKTLSELRQLKSLKIFQTQGVESFQVKRLFRLEEITFTLILITSTSWIEELGELPRLKRIEVTPAFTFAPDSTVVKVAAANEAIEPQMRTLARLHNLERLDASSFNDAMLLALCRLFPDGQSPLQGLKELRLSPSITTNAGLTNLQNIPNLVHLDLSHSSLTDDGLVALQSIATLRTLYLCGCYGISDEGMEVLAKLTGLESLNLGNTRTTQNGLLRLTTLKRLRVLRLSGYGGGVTPELRQHLPPTCKFDTR